MFRPQKIQRDQQRDTENEESKKNIKKKEGEKEEMTNLLTIPSIPRPA